MCKRRVVESYDIDLAIKEIQYYHFPDTTVVTCCLKMWDHSYIVGVSVADSHTGFIPETGKRLALNNAKEKAIAAHNAISDLIKF